MSHFNFPNSVMHDQVPFPDLLRTTKRFLWLLWLLPAIFSSSWKEFSPSLIALKLLSSAFHRRKLKVRAKVETTTTWSFTKTLKQNYQIDLSKSNFYELIGFDVKIIKDRTNFGPRVPNLSQDNDILNIHCDLVSDSLVDGEESDLIYLFWTSVLRSSLRPCLHGVGDPGLVG